MTGWAAGCWVSAIVIPQGHRDRAPGGGRGPARQADRGDPHPQRGRQPGRTMPLECRQRHPAGSHQADHHYLSRDAALTPARGQAHGCCPDIHGDGRRDGQPDPGQARRRMAIETGDHHDRDESPSQRAQHLALTVPALTGARPRLRHPGRSLPGYRRGRRLPGIRRTMGKARRCQPCPHGHSLARGGRRRQIRHGYQRGPARGARLPRLSSGGRARTARPAGSARRPGPSSPAPRSMRPRR